MLPLFELPLRKLAHYRHFLSQRQSTHLSVQKHQDGEKDKEISDLKKIIESKDLAISGLIKQNDEAKKIHDKDVKALADKDDQILLLQETNQHTTDELYCFVNKCGKYKSDVASLKSKIKRERIIILIVIVILTAPIVTGKQ